MGKVSEKIFSPIIHLQVNSLWKGSVNLFYSQVGGQIIYKLNKGTLVYSQAEWQGPLRQAITYDCNNKSNKKQVRERVSNR